MSAQPQITSICGFGKEFSSMAVLATASPSAKLAVMKLHPLLLTLPFVFAACAPAATPQTLSITLEKTMTEDVQATILTNATLTFAGATTQTLALDEIQGDLMYVDPTTYPLYKQDGSDVVAILTAWWAGQGEEIVIRQTDDAHIVIEHRYGAEDGTCTDPEQLADFALSGKVQSTLENFGEPVAQSSIQFCQEQAGATVQE